jgi:hypothetical protein
LKGIKFWPSALCAAAGFCHMPVNAMFLRGRAPTFAHFPTAEGSRYARGNRKTPGNFDAKTQS